MKKQTAILILVGIVVSSLPFAVLKAQTKHSAPLAAPTKGTLERATPEAVALWKRLRSAGGANGVPIHANVIVTSFGRDGNLRRKVNITMEEGTGGRYRLTYTSPSAVQGRVVIFDGAHLYQFEPAHKLVLKRSLQNEETMLPDEVDSTTSFLVPVIEGNDTVLGRPVQKLAFHDQMGRTIRRCFIDTETGHSLRTEEYSPETGKPLRRVEKTSFAQVTEANDALFRPDFPQGIRTLNATPRRSANLDHEKVKLGLPTVAGRYRLRTVMRPTTKPNGDSTNTAHQALYSDGAHTVSVFVTPLPTPDARLAPPDGNGWKPVTVTKEASGFAREDERGRTGIVWLRAGKRYVLAARLPLTELLPLAQNLCGNL